MSLHDSNRVNNNNNNSKVNSSSNPNRSTNSSNNNNINTNNSLQSSERTLAIFPVFLLILITTADSGASSTPKNLVNLYTHTTNENSNFSGVNQFQNEYQYRHSPPKSSTSERSSSIRPTTPSATDPAYDNSPNDFEITGVYDYPYQDGSKVSTNVPECKGRLKLTNQQGFITDGPGVYPINLQCIWIIDSGRQLATIRIRFHQFNTECNYDYLYIFDGDSIYSPLVAALSGDMKDFSTALVEPRYENTISNDTSVNSNSFLYSAPSSTSSDLLNLTQPFEIKTKSGKAFIYFHSDTAQGMPGFYMTYTIDSCPLDCSNRGECDYSALTCKCKSRYYGEGCQYLLCPNNCTSPINGSCDMERSCICREGFRGIDCSIVSSKQQWIRQLGLDHVIPTRAFHQAIVVDDTMWIIGGKTQKFSNTNRGINRIEKTSMIYSYDIESKKWSDNIIMGETGIDHLAEISGHSVAAKGSKVFIYGGLALNYSVLDVLTVLDTKKNLLTTLTSEKKFRPNEEELIAPIAVVGHSANIIDGHMYIFLGYNPLYGYLNLVQKFNLADNSWSIVERKGSSVVGCIGHTSTYDANSRLVYIYGGHNAHKSNNLYSFDPYLGTWKFLQTGPSPRYYHSAIIIDWQLVVLGGNSYNISHQSDQCFQQTSLDYDISCSRQLADNKHANITLSKPNCSRNCWRVIDDSEPSVLKRYGHSVVVHNRKLILFGGFNGVLMNDLRTLDIGSCSGLQDESSCLKPQLGLDCRWNSEKRECKNSAQISNTNSTSIATVDLSNYECSKDAIKPLQQLCEHRETCNDCLNTDAGCVWCGFLGLCQYNRCRLNNKPLVNLELCYKDEPSKAPVVVSNFGSHLLKDLQVVPNLDDEMHCKRIENCHLCQSTSHCSWQSDSCIYSPNLTPTSASSSSQPDEYIDMYGNNGIINPKTSLTSNSSRALQKFDPINRSFLNAFYTSLLNSSPYQICDIPCYLRHSCNECTTSKCIWCSTTQQCIESPAYFAYHAMGQCMHYVAHNTKCPISSCSGIESCDKCLTNPKCGWLNDISNTGKGKCIDGTSSGPSFFGDGLSLYELRNSSSIVPLTSWYYSECPSCQCNGHSYCKSGSNICILPCQDNTGGAHCDRCAHGFYGNPTNGGTCHPCRCNGHAESCHRETGKCHCSTKGIIGHTCNRCDNQNHYIGDPTSLNNGTCYYNLTTDYHYTFNMSKADDHYYSDINFINVPLRKDSDADFTIACSRLALVNITSGTSYKNRKPLHTGLECGNLRLRFQHDRHMSSEANHSFFVHVYKFQTPLILQIAFSQHRTLYLPQFFFTLSSCFLFFFTLSGLVWKAKHEYDLYIQRQRQFIEMEHMASRPFSTILLEMFRPTTGKALNQQIRSPAEPTPISFEPCHKGHVGVLSFFVQLPGRPHLAIGSALVTLSDDANNSSDDNGSNKQAEKEVP